MIRNFFCHLWDSILNLKRNIWMTIASVSTVSITLSILAIFAAVLLNAERLATGLENNVKINTYLSIDSTDAYETVTNDAGETVTNDSYHHLYNQIKAIDGVKSVTFSSKDEQLEKVKEAYGDDWALTDGDSNPLYDVYIVEVDNPDNVKEVSATIEKMEGVNSVNYGGINTERLFNLAQFIQTWGLAGTALLLFLAIFLISNTVRMTIMSRQRDIEIMRLVGAKNSYIRGPFFFEGAWVGIIGAIIPAVTIHYLYNYVYSKFNASLETQGLSLYPADSFVLWMLVSMILIGVIIGSIGSIISMRRYLKV